jgi:hypothetical protein
MHTFSSIQGRQAQLASSRVHLLTISYLKGHYFPTLTVRLCLLQAPLTSLRRLRCLQLKCIVAYTALM